MHYQPKSGLFASCEAVKVLPPGEKEPRPDWLTYAISVGQVYWQGGEQPYYTVELANGRRNTANVGDYLVKSSSDWRVEVVPAFLFEEAWEPAKEPGPFSAKSLHNTDINGARKNVSDIKVFGDGDMFKLMCKASSESQGWMKSTKACEVPGGCIVQVTTQQRNPDGSYAVAEAVTFVPDVVIEEMTDENGNVTGRRFTTWGS